MKYILALLISFRLVSCNSKRIDYEALSAYKKVTHTTTNGTWGFEKNGLKVGDSIQVYGGSTGFLKSHFGCDTCSGRIDKLFFSKPTGNIAFVSFKNNPSQVVTYSLTLYFWDNKRGYNVSTLVGWERAMTNPELKYLQFELATPIANRSVENNLYFKRKN